MAYALVGTIGAASQAAISTAVTPAWGTSENRTAGNLLICFVSVSRVTTTPTTPSGWSRATTTSGTATSATIYWKNATGSDTAPTIAAITNGIIAAQLAEFSGAPSTIAVDTSSVNSGTSSPITSTHPAPDKTSGELLLMCGADSRSVARTPNDTWTSNSGTVTQAGNNNGVSTLDHYSFGYIAATTQNASADTVTMTCSVTQSISGLAVVSASFPLPVITLPDLFQQPLVPADQRFYWK